MVKFKYSNPHYCEPPGCHVEYVNGGNTKVAIVQHHRFALFYWNKWAIQKNRTHSVFSIDYHHDLCPIDFASELRKLDLSNDEEVAKFCWARMRVLNDTHPKTAMYLDVISDFHSLCRQDYNSDLSIIDKNRKEHFITIYDDLDSFEIAIRDAGRLIIDIDLDYFITNYNSEETKRLATKAKITSTIDFMKRYWSKIEGITIATEPSHCAGILNSNKMLNIILTCLRA